MRKSRVLLVRTSDSVQPIERLLGQRNFDVHTAMTWDEAWWICEEIPLPELQYVLVESELHDRESLGKLMRRIRPFAPDAVLLVFDPEHAHALYALLQNGAPKVLDSSAQRSATPVFVAESPNVRGVFSLAGRYASYDLTVLITGETGVGKEVVARYIHNHSNRKDRPLVACNLTAVPETLVESELFGYVKGAFTGADRNKKGLIEAAEGGTLFLDEIGDLPATIQLKLMRFLETREFYRVGESTPRQADVRILAATNVELEKAIEHGFRQDLYYRLNSARIIVPPLRERPDDILPFAEAFLARMGRDIERPDLALSPSVESLLLDYPWPGNVRELRNVIENAAVVATGDTVTLNDLPMHLQHYGMSHRDEIGAQTLRRIDEAERQVIHEALRKSGGDKTRAARDLGISVRTLYRKLEKFPAPGPLKRNATVSA